VVKKERDDRVLICNPFLLVNSLQKCTTQMLAAVAQKRIVIGAEKAKGIQLSARLWFYLHSFTGIYNRIEMAQSTNLQDPNNRKMVRPFKR